MKKLRGTLIGLALVYLVIINILNLHNLYRYKGLTDDLLIQAQESQRIAREALDLLEDCNNPKAK